jgi:phosphoglycerate kinase
VSTDDETKKAARGEAMRSASAEALAGKLRLDDLDVDGRRVLVRADLNLPVQEGVVTDDTRLVATLPTLRALLDAGAVPVVMSHRGRPGGKPDEALTMAPVADALGGALEREVASLPDCIGDEVEAAVGKLQPGEVALLENLRFHAGETSNDESFARRLAALADLYVNDAFGAAHRAHASTAGVTRFVQQAAAGRLLELEVDMLSRCLDEPDKPFVLVAGGAKVSDKLDAVGNLMPLVDRLLIGGAMANSVLACRGFDMGRSRIEEGSLELAAGLLERAEESGVQVLLPDDFVVAPDFDGVDEARVVDSVPADQMALDIGPQSARRFAAALADAATVLWNGPMGVFEVERLAAGTRVVGEAIAAVKARGGLSIIGGGDTAAATAQLGLSDSMSHVSTGGGASLDLLSGVVLPGIAALSDR